MNVERLKDVAEVLRGVPDAQFRIETWWRSNCNSVGCAVGHYITARPGCGLELHEEEDDDGAYLNGYGADEFNAVSLHFDLKYCDATYLFARWRYPNGRGTTRADVIARIESFIASGGVIEPAESVVQ